MMDIIIVAEDTEQLKSIGTVWELLNNPGNLKVQVIIRGDSNWKSVLENVINGELKLLRTYH